jgi:hypothetical protein
MLNIQPCTADFWQENAVDGHGQLICSSVFALLTQRCCSSDGVLLTEKGGGGLPHFYRPRHLIRSFWLPMLLWEGELMPFLFHNMNLDALVLFS